MTDITLYASIASRSFTAFWMLEELAIPYTWKETDIKERQHKSPEYLKINPSGRVPAIAVDGIVVTERPAICAYLADRFSYGELAPRIEAPERGPYLKWLVYAGTVLDPALAMARGGIEPRPDFTWNALDAVTTEIAGALDGTAWVLGDRFSAADVMLGSVIAMALYNGLMPEHETVRAYNDRLMARPACQRAGEKTWPPSLFGGTA
jgi:glutathione S-transferase